MLSAGVILGSALVGLAIHFLLFWLLSIYKDEARPVVRKSVSKWMRTPLLFFLPLLAVAFTLPLHQLAPHKLEVARRITETLLSVGFAFVLIRVVRVAEDLITNKLHIAKPDNFRERKLLTQLQFIKKVIIVFIAFFTVALVLMSFQTVRKLGTGLLTSAGIAGVIVGFAAQRSIANLLAGFQLAFTQPIRLDDVLVIEGEWGKVEEITLTYVVVRLWDERRLVVPLNYFIEKPFQNWTRRTADLLGTVFIYTDYTFPVDKLRHELLQIVQSTKLWDGRVCLVQVTDITPDTMQIRAMVSSTSSGDLFDLRCLVRERLVSFVQENFPNALPKTRTELFPLDNVTSAANFTGKKS